MVCLFMLRLTYACGTEPVPARSRQVNSLNSDGHLVVIQDIHPDYLALRQIRETLRSCGCFKLILAGFSEHYREWDKPICLPLVGSTFRRYTHGKRCFVVPRPIFSR
jgi:hypothetical protein